MWHEDVITAVGEDAAVINICLIHVIELAQHLAFNCQGLTH